MWFELLTFFIGIVFGFLHKGKEDYRGILRNGIIFGVIVGLTAVLISTYLAPGCMSVGFDFLGAFGIILVVIVFVILLVIGAFLGDLLERTFRRR